MTSVKELEKKIKTITERNNRVESDKAWETSWTRRILITLLTYVVIVLFFVAAGFPKPMINAIVPCVGFVISTLTLGLCKNLWLANRK